MLELSQHSNLAISWAHEKKKKNSLKRLYCFIKCNNALMVISFMTVGCERSKITASEN